MGCVTATEWKTVVVAHPDKMGAVVAALTIRDALKGTRRDAVREESPQRRCRLWRKNTGAALRGGRPLSVTVGQPQGRNASTEQILR